jgi:ABC-type dipeptide/oligopeptide/nickel transport system permease component
MNQLNTYMRTWNYNERTTKRARIVGTLLTVVPMWFVISVISFLAVGCVTESNINQIITDTPTPAKNGMMPFLIHRLGKDQPIHIHYLRWIGLMKQEDGQYQGVLQGDLGHSIWE